VLFMKFQQLQSSLAVTWIVCAGLIGLFGNVTSIGGVALVLGCALVPPLLLLMLQWNHPAQAVTVYVHQTNP